MSQNAPLSEAELLSLINQYLELKLDKEDFVRPTRRSVTDVYSKFLDHIGCNWRKNPVDPDREPTYRTLLLRGLIPLFRPYNEFEFGHNDIVKPTRKRTVYFMNVVLYLIVEFENHRRQWDGFCTQSEENQEKVEKFRDELDRKRRERDELALEIGSHMSDQEYSDLIAKKQANIQQLEDKGIELKKEYESLKAQIAAEMETRQERQEAIKLSRDGIESLRRRLKLKDDVVRRKEKLNKLSNDLEQRKLTSGLKRSQLTTELETLAMERSQFKLDMDAKMDRLRMERKKISDKMIDLDKRRNERLKRAEDFENYMDKAIRSLSAKHEKSTQLTVKLYTTVTNYNMRMRSHFVQTSNYLPDTNVNRTFTKSTAK